MTVGCYDLAETDIFFFTVRGILCEAVVSEQKKKTEPILYISSVL